MPLYFFHVDDGGRAQDRLGVELPDLQRARTEAALLAGELLRERPDAFWQARAWTTTVTDAAGMTLFSIQVAGRAGSDLVLPSPTPLTERALR